MRYRHAIMAAAVMAASQGHGQSPTASATAAPTPTRDRVDEGEAAAPSEIIVTGTRIARTEFNAPNPVTAFSAVDLARSGNTNLTDFLLRSPALAGSLDNTQAAGYESLARAPFGGAGLNELNLRNLGTNRTLVLVDGRRHVAGEFNTAAVDINAIPTDLVERVDVLTGGASAIYGADGVSGVVNFILKRNFNGMTARGQVGISTRGDAGNRLGAVTLGQNFAGDRGNVTLAYEYFASDPLGNDDRDYLRQDKRQYLIQTGDPNDDPRVPDQILIGDLRYPGESINGAVYLDDGDFVPDFDGDGSRYVEGRRVGGYSTGGSSTPVAGFVGDLLPRIERNAVNILTRYDFNDAFKLRLEGKFVQVRAQTLDQYTGDYPSLISADNPFIPATIRPFVTATGLTIFRDNFDFGRHGEADRRRTFRGVISANGRLTDHLRYDAYYTYGRTEARITKLKSRLADRYLAALDVITDPTTGRPVCRSNLFPATVTATTFTPGPNSGCAPLNIFGNGSPSQAALNFFQIDHASTATITQQVASGSVSGDFGALFTLPGGAVGFSIGGEYRRESSRFSPNSYLVNGQFYQFDESPVVLPSFGSFDVTEGFAELSAPVFSGAPFAETLTFGAAVRLSKYSTVGRTTAYELKGVYAPVRDISFRGSYSNSVRAPNIGELFAPGVSTQTFFSDPCDPTAIGNGTSFRPANCRAIVTATGANFATFSPLSDNFIPARFGTQSGNPKLAAETARTWTAGVVLRPRFLPGLTLSIDWYDIRLRGAISVPGGRQLAELCVDQPTIDNVFCRSITRAPGSGFINGYSVQPQNVSQFRSSGADLNLAYVIRTRRAGTFNLNLIGGYLHRSDFVNTPGAPAVDAANQGLNPRNPRWVANFSPTWTLGAVTVSYNLRFAAKTLRYDRFTLAAQPDVAAPDLVKFKALWQHDLQVQAQVDDRFSIYLGATNLFDQRPDRDSYDIPVSPLGRFVYVGGRISLGN